MQQQRIKDVITEATDRETNPPRTVITHNDPCPTE
jgi:hypothetical protein